MLTYSVFYRNIFVIFMEKWSINVEKSLKWKRKSDLNPIIFTLKEPRFFTEHAIRTFLPAGTVTLSIIAVNSGSSEMAIFGKTHEKWKEREKNERKELF